MPLSQPSDTPFLWMDRTTGRARFAPDQATLTRGGYSVGRDGVDDGGDEQADAVFTVLPPVK